MSGMLNLRNSILSAMGLYSAILTPACLPNWSDLPVGEDEDEDDDADANDYGECADFEVSTLPSFEELTAQNEGYPKGRLQTYCVDEFDTWEDCLSCEEDCQWDIEDEFSDTYFYSDWGYVLDIECGPMWLDDRCCFVTSPEGWAEGRPYRVDGQIRQAEVRSGNRWVLQQSVQSIPRKLRRHLAKHWTKQALSEHASVASFARFGLQLMHLGAPPELLVESARAMADEVGHARRCFGLAAAYGAIETEPGGIDATGADGGDIDFRTLLLETFADGCIHETLAAAEARVLAERAEDPVLRDTLHRIAVDETRHSTLAWKTIAWVLQHQPELSIDLSQAWKELQLEWTERFNRLSEEVPVPHLDRLGVLDGPGRAVLGRQVLRDVIDPCLKALIERGIDAQTFGHIDAQPVA